MNMTPPLSAAATTTSDSGWSNPDEPHLRGDEREEDVLAGRDPDADEDHTGTDDPLQRRRRGQFALLDGTDIRFRYDDFGCV